MPIIKIVNESYKRKEDMLRLLYYIAERAEVISGFGISINSVESILREFEFVKRYWNKAEEGRRQVRHLIVSFEDEYLPLVTVSELAWEIGKLYGNRFQVFYGIHTDTAHTHVHYAINTVSFVDGIMFSEGYKDFQILKNNVAAICAQINQ